MKPKIIKQFTLIYSEEYNENIIVKTCPSNLDYVTISQGSRIDEQQEIVLPKESLYTLREILDSFLN
jgi:hypothetical protein